MKLRTNLTRWCADSSIYNQSFDTPFLQDWSEGEPVNELMRPEYESNSSGAICAL